MILYMRGRLCRLVIAPLVCIQFRCAHVFLHMYGKDKNETTSAPPPPPPPGGHPHFGNRQQKALEKESRCGPSV